MAQHTGPPSAAQKTGLTFPSRRRPATSYDEWAELNTNLIAKCRNQDVYEENVAYCRRYGLRSTRVGSVGIDEADLMDSFLSQMLIKLLTQNGILFEGKPYTQLPKLFVQLAETWLESRGCVILGWPRGLPFRSVSKWPTATVFAVSAMLLKGTIRIEPSHGSGQDKQSKKMQLQKVRLGHFADSFGAIHIRTRNSIRKKETTVNRHFVEKRITKLTSETSFPLPCNALARSTANIEHEMQVLLRGPGVSTADLSEEESDSDSYTQSSALQKPSKKAFDRDHSQHGRGPKVRGRIMEKRRPSSSTTFHVKQQAAQTSLKSLPMSQPKRSSRRLETAWKPISRRADRGSHPKVIPTPLLERSSLFPLPKGVDLNTLSGQSLDELARKYDLPGL